MANKEHLAILMQGVDVWNEWRRNNPDVRPDLSGANLSEADLRRADLSKAYLAGARLFGANLGGANLSGANLGVTDLSRANLYMANLIGAHLFAANLSEADLSEANLMDANLRAAHLRNAQLRKTDLSGVNLTDANLSEAYLRKLSLEQVNLSGFNLSNQDLSGSNLSRTMLIGTDFSNSNLSGCNIYGISIWDTNLEGTIQKDLVITPYDQPAITVDSIEIAQFIYMLINNKKVRDAIDTLTSKAVLILGRFTDDRKPVLDAIREELRQRNYIPILFDFEKPDSRDLTETIVTLAHMSRFIIADLTDAKSLPLELQAIVPNLLSVAVQPIILREQRPFAMFEHIQRYQSVLTIYEYDTQEQVIAELVDKIIVPAEEKVKELRPKPLA